MGCLGLLKFTLLWLIKSRRAGIRTQEGRSEVTQAVSYLSYPGLSDKATFMSGGGLIPYLVVLLAAGQTADSMLFQDASTIKSLMSCSYSIVPKNVNTEVHRHTCMDI